MKQFRILTAMLVLIFLLTACGSQQAEPNGTTDEMTVNAVEIGLSDSEITVDGFPAETSPDHRVYIGNDIVYYEAGKDFTYGEGSADDAHSAEAAAAHTVVHITEPGTYRLNGFLSKGQIAVDLGDEAESNPEAVVTLLLDGVNISCEVAPAIIFYNVYECSSADTDGATKDVDTSSAGANVIIADGTTNTVNGSYVARIYKPDSVVLNEDGTEVEDAKKLHKYDAAFYSRMSMNVGGGSENSGILTINAENEGLDSELHLTINGGVIHINSGNDGINTNEDGVSVTTVNGGELHIRVTGESGEGDGIDSNGWLVINGGTVIAQACSFSADAGIDSDMGIHINGGTVLAAGHMLDRIEDGGQSYAVFSFAEKQKDTICLKDESGNSLFETDLNNDYSIIVYSSPDLAAGNHTLWCNGVQMAGQQGGMTGRPEMPDGAVLPEPPEGGFHDGTMPAEPHEGMMPPEDGKAFEGQLPPEGMERPEGGNPNGQWKPEQEHDGLRQETTTEFLIFEGGNMFQNISQAE